VKRLYARMMEVYAGALSHADNQIGRLLDAVQANLNSRMRSRTSPSISFSDRAIPPGNHVVRFNFKYDGGASVRVQPVLCS
jgi:hypothetical protein